MALLTSGLLNQNSSKISKTQSLGIELYLTNMKPNTLYHCYADGILVDAFCKPYGKDLGANIISDKYGKCLVLYLLNIDYAQAYTNISTTDIMTYKKTIQFKFVDPSGVESVVYYPILLKPTK